MTDNISHDSGYFPLRNQPAEYEGDYTSPGTTGLDLITITEEILHELKAPTVRPRTQLVFKCEPTALVSQVESSHVRLYIDTVIIPATPASPFTIRIGTSNFLRGWNVAGEFHTSFIIDAGADIQLSAVAAISAAGLDIIFVGEIIN